MTERTVQEENEIAKAKRLSKIRDRARLFREVLGTPRGAMIVDALRSRFELETRYVPNMCDDRGRTDIYQTARKHGQSDIINFILDQLEWKEGDKHVNTSTSST